MTATGKTKPEAMGITDTHNHLWLSPTRLPIKGLRVLDDEGLVPKELKEFRELGCVSQVNCQAGELGRDGNSLKQLSRRIQIYFVACSGFHLMEYFLDGGGPWQLDREQAADHFLMGIREGLPETGQAYQPFQPGLIKIAGRESLDRVPSLPMVCDLATRPNPGLHLERAQAGCLLEKDTFFRPKHAPEDIGWRLIPAIVKAGWLRSIAAAADLVNKTLWRVRGDGPSMAGFIGQIQARLVALFPDREFVDQFMGWNISNRLVVKT